MLKGAKNISLYSNICKPAKFVMSYPLLKLIGHEIAISHWSNETKTIFWAACCLAFFGSFRLGEILPKNDKTSPETLTWSNVSFEKKNSAVINIKFPKIIHNPKGDFIDIFKINNCPCCPFTALKNLRDLNHENVEKNYPVFLMKNGKNLTPKLFSETVVLILKKHIGENAKKFSGHSFRAGIPAALANHPDLANDSDIMTWGRWSSDSFKSYTRLKHHAKLSIFRKILSVLDLK
jgi:hypothetical protein